MTLAFLSYSTAAVAYLAGLFLLMRAWRTPGAPRVVAFGLGITSAWAAVLAADAHGVQLPVRLVAAIDVLRFAVWFMALSAIGAQTLPRWLTHSSLFLCVLSLALGLVLPLERAATIYTLSGLALSFVGLVLVEQQLRNASESLLPAAKLVAIGIGGQFAYDLFLYSQAQLFGAVDSYAWVARGFALTLLLPTLVLAVRRLSEYERVVFVSRQVIFYTTSLVAIGVYLCAMAIGGYYVRAQGGAWGESLQMLFMFGAAIVLASLMLSSTLSRRLKVFIATHFYRNKYDYRVEWLRFIQTLSSGHDGDSCRIAIQAVAQIFQSPGGLMFLRDERTQFFKLVSNWPEPSLADSRAMRVAVGEDLPRLLEHRQWVIDTDEYRATPDLYANIRLPDWLLAAGEWRVVVPLLHVERLVGFLVLRPPPPPYRMTFEDRDLFKTVGRHVALQMVQQDADQKLTESRQFDAYNRFSAFVMHDLKNSVAQLQLLVGNASRHRANPEFFDDAVSTIANTAERMTRLIAQLQGKDVQGQVREVPLAPLLDGAIERTSDRRPEPTLDNGLAGECVRADAEKLSSILEHVVRNAQDAAGSNGSVRARATVADGHAMIEIADDGPGMDPQFVRDRLFRPFDSTKGSKGMGIGAYQTREYVRQLGGEVDVESSPGRGTHFYIRLPLCLKKNRES